MSVSTRRRVTASVALLSVALLVGACGASDGDGTAPTTDGPTDSTGAPLPNPDDPRPMGSAGGTGTTTDGSRRPGVSGGTDTDGVRIVNAYESRDARDPARVLGDLAVAQARCIHRVLIDEDYDGIGEYAGLAELAGARAGRMKDPLSDVLIRTELGQLDAWGASHLGGYAYRVFLPGKAGLGIGESKHGFGSAQLDINLTEDEWIAYAWPLKGDGPVYCVDRRGDVYETAGGYVGTGRGPEAGSALRGKPENEERMLGRAGGTGRDGREWTLVR